jgi:hypothetical protein
MHHFIDSLHYHEYWLLYSSSQTPLYNLFLEGG